MTSAANIGLVLTDIVEFGLHGVGLVASIEQVLVALHSRVVGH